MTSAKIGANHIPKGVVAVIFVKNRFYAMFLADLVPVAPIEDLSLICSSAGKDTDEYDLPLNPRIQPTPL